MTKKTKETSYTQSTNSQSKTHELPRYLSWGVVILSVVNVLFLVMMIILIGKLESVSKTHAQERNKLFDRTKAEDLSVYEYELETNRALIERISNSFPNETGLLEFINGVEKLKDGGSVTKISFTSKQPLKDDDGYLGIPILIEFKGAWGEILSDIQKIQKLPYVFKPVKLETQQNVFSNNSQEVVTNPDEVEVVFGGFLYVDEKFSKN